jgi:hypothetical protein
LPCCGVNTMSGSRQLRKVSPSVDAQQETR